MYGKYVNKIMTIYMKGEPRPHPIDDIIGDINDLRKVVNDWRKVVNDLRLQNNAAFDN